MPLTLYTFRRCPYAIRARWALLITSHEFIWREINLKDKPKELLHVSPNGTVPVLLIDPKNILSESFDIILWSTRKNIKYRLKDNELSKVKMIIEENDSLFKYYLDRYKYPSRYPDEDRFLNRQMAKEILIKWNSILTWNNYDNFSLLFSRETIADWSLWPFVRQFRNIDKDYFDSDSELKKLRRWLFYYTEHKYFPLLMSKTNPWTHNDVPIYFPSIKYNYPIN